MTSKIGLANNQSSLKAMKKMFDHSKYLKCYPYVTELVSYHVLFYYFKKQKAFISDLYVSQKLLRYIECIG